MLILGLTGSIGMGKSTTAGLFREAGIAVHDADGVVHRLYAGEAAPLIEAAFPGTTGPQGVNRTALGRAVLGDAAALRRLEALIHPLVAHQRDLFLDEQRRKGAALVVLDIPLLFETGGEALVDVIIVVSAPKSVQKHRVLARPGMNLARFKAIMAQQLPDAEKRRRAHFVLDTGSGVEPTRRAVQRLLRALAGQ
ncbi:MAG: dephospho-CoA kinase [Hyphomicrobiales bacterium]|nr:dephospho-CoA kinase [Hyphomicrobiales bacterium]